MWQMRRAYGWPRIKWARATESGPPETATRTRDPAGTCERSTAAARSGQDMARKPLFRLIAGVSGKDAGTGIEVGGGIVDGDGGLPKTADDQLHFAGVMRDVAGGIDAREVCFHFGRDGDVIALESEAPLRQRAHAGVKSQAGKHFVRPNDFFRLGFVVDENHRFQMFLAAQLLHLIKELEGDPRFLKLRDAFFMGTKSITPMDERHRGRDRFQV